MGTNIIDQLKGQFGTTLIENASVFLGEDKIATKKAIDIVLPSLLAGVSNQATSVSNASRILDFLKSGGHDGQIFNSSLNILLGGGSATQGLIDSGKTIINALFGDKSSGINDWIAAFAGIKTGSASSLMSMIAPFLMGTIGKKVLGENLGVSGLMGLLGGQTDVLRSSLPKGLIDVLGVSNINLNPPSVEKTLVHTNDKSLFSRLMPWLVLLIAGLLGLNYLKTCKYDSPEARQATVVEELPTIKVDSVKSISLPSKESISVKTGSFLDKLNNFITSETFDSNIPLTFDNINFATNSADITQDSKGQLDDLVKILKAYPKVEIKIVGHTDNKGDDTKNKKLSTDRAESVKKYLITKEISSTRVTTEGLGASKPTADNNTEDGRAKNRRIEAFVIKK